MCISPFGNTVMLYTSNSVCKCDTEFRLTNLQICIQNHPRGNLVKNQIDHIIIKVTEYEKRSLCGRLVSFGAMFIFAYLCFFLPKIAYFYGVHISQLSREPNYFFGNFFTSNYNSVLICCVPFVGDKSCKYLH